MKRSRYAVLAGALALSTVVMFVGAGATGASAAESVYTCSGTLKAPGVLTGTHGNVNVKGVCAVNAGAAIVNGNLVIYKGAALVAAFGRNDRTNSGTSSLTVTHTVSVLQGGAAIIGCEPQAFPCIDDPNPKHPTLSSAETIKESLLAQGVLGVIVHNTHIGVDVIQSEGGGGYTCKPSGIFAAFQSPVYSDFEDNTVGRNMTIQAVTSCWLGALRNNIGGSFVALSNRMNDPDAMELLSNTIHANILCSGNQPAPQYGDSHSSPNVVSGSASGQCGFNVRKPDPAPHGPLTPISVRAK
jgi:hypothetical protein